MVVACAGTLSCALPRSYQSPRTTPAGRVAHSLAFELGQGFFEQRDREEETLLAPEGYNLATYTARVGVAERWDVAGSVGTALLAGEVKWNFLRSPLLDVAVAPRAQYFEPLPPPSLGNDDRNVVTFSLPVPVGLNLNREFSFVAAPALAYGAGSRPATYDDERQQDIPALYERGFLGALALDLQLRPSAGFAIQPGVTLYQRLPSGETRWQAGIAFNFGRLPRYAELEP